MNESPSESRHNIEDDIKKNVLIDIRARQLTPHETHGGKKKSSSLFFVISILLHHHLPPSFSVSCT